MRTLALVMLLALPCCLSSSQMAEGAKEEGRPMLKASEFTILPWGWTPGDPQQLEWIKECGFNLAGFVSPNDLDEVEKAGLQCIVSDPDTHVSDAAGGMTDEEIAKRVKALVDRTGKSKAVYGYYLRDEPGAWAFAGLGRWAAAFRKAAPEKLPYINLFPNYAGAGLGVDTYDEYLEEFVKQVEPDFISYDHYAVMDDGSLRDLYFPNLEAVRKAALRHRLPFWNIVLSNAHFAYTEPSPATLRFQAFTTLAYGARGISYFTYFAPRIGNYRLAPIDQFGNKTPTWDMLRNVNLQIHALGPVFVTLKSVNVFHTPNVPEGCMGMDSARLVEKAEGGDLLVGEFTGPKGEPYAMIVNKSLKDSCFIGVQFKKQGQVIRVSAYTGQVQPWSGEDVWLAPGQGMLLGVN